MRKLVVWAVCLMSVVFVQAQSRWSITPEAGLVVNKPNSSTDVGLGFKVGAGVLYEIKPEKVNRPSFGIKSGLYMYQQNGQYDPWNSSNMIPGTNFRKESVSNESRRYYLQLPVMAHWSWKLCDDVRLNLAVGPYVALGVAGKTEYFVSATNLEGDWRHHNFEFNPFKGKEKTNDMEFEAAPRFDWGGTASAGITVKRISFNIGYDMAFGKIYKHQNDMQVRNHMVSFTFGYRL